MNKQILAVAFAMAVGGSGVAQPMTLKEAAQEAVIRNPEVLSRWHNYKAAAEEVEMARGGYRPRVDLAAEVARERLDDPDTPSTRYTRRGVSLYLTQMLFDGFATRSDVKRLGYAQRVRYFELLDASENVAVEVMRAYNDVLRYRKLHQLAQENYVQHRLVFEQIQDRVKAGVGRRVDLEQASGRLALAESNLLTEVSNLHDVSARFQRIVGRLPAPELEDLGPVDKGIPGKAGDALRLAYQINPALAAAQENILHAQTEAKGRRSAYMPRLELQARKDLGWNLDGLEGRHSTDSIGLVLNYNLYNGGTDQAAERHYWERYNIARDLRDKSCRDIRQTLLIAHNDVGRLAEQLAYLEQHQLSTAKARDAYRKQFDIGQRTLLDLLDTENELFQAKRAYINAYHDHVMAFGRTQGAMGNLLTALGLSPLETPDLPAASEKAEFDADSVCPPLAPEPATLDKDKLYADALAANPALLQQPLIQDSDADGVPDVRDRCPATPAGDKVDGNGCPVGDVISLKGVNFAANRAELRPDATILLDNGVEFLKRNSDLNVEVAGHTDDVGPEAENLALSEQRARAVRDYFVAQGIAARRLSVRGYGESQPVADNGNEAGRAMNRRVELRILK